jgi:hypothetical protein
MFDHLVSVQQKTRHISVTKINQSTQFTEMIFVYYEAYTPRGQNIVTWLTIDVSIRKWIC